MQIIAHPSLRIGPIRGYQYRGRRTALRNAPNYVEGIAVLILLQNQHAWTLWKVGVILHDASIGQPTDRLIRQYTVCGQFIVTMVGDYKVPTPSEFLDPL